MAAKPPQPAEYLPVLHATDGGSVVLAACGKEYRLLCQKCGATWLTTTEWLMVPMVAGRIT